MKRSAICVGLAFTLALMQTVAICAQAPASGATQTSPADDALTEKIKARVQKLGVRKDVTITLHDRDQHCGTIKNIDADKFLIYEVDMKQLLEISYTDVKKIESGYGHGRDINGQRISPHKHLIGIGLIAALAVVILLSVPRD
jgi:hypothetical protein